ncbi:DMT family transporter [Salinisphaera hydrothermalis]|uniref:DMT family transporter n=1 Tax=Salinisphaera hydrothermalis TaxID=563188 RepID=UPI00334025DB
MTQRNMSNDRHVGLASLCVLGAGCLWGLYWIPVRALAAAGLTGATGSLVVVAIALAILIVALLLRREPIGHADGLALAASATGGAAFMLYSIGLVEGRVSSVILLFYLTPVWTTMITAFVLRWPVPRLRYAVIALGLVGLVLVLGADGGVPLPHAPGEWLGLAAGVLWSISSVGMRVRGELAPWPGSAVFAAGALAAGLLVWALLPVGSTGPIHADGATGAWALAAATVWWIGSMLALVWATTRLEPARVGILLMSEVLVGVVSSALFAGETLTGMQIAGAALLLAVGVLDALG